MLNNKVVLITGGTGSFGKKFVEVVLRDYPQVKKLIVYSRNEQNQLDMQTQFPDTTYPAMRYFIGDIRDAERLRRACEGVDVIIHAAAIRNVNTATYNPDECIKTNILGAQNVINAALACGVHDVIALSSEKACAPTTLYGATKLTSDKLFTAANNLSGTKDIRFSVVRFSSVLGGSGSAYPIWKQALDQRKTTLPVTDKQMTRFNISMVEAVQTVLFALEHHVGGEIFVPKCMSYHITDLAKAMAPSCQLEETGLRTNEKLHEELITNADAQDTIDLGNYYAILPAVTFNHSREEMLQHHGARFVASDFHYCSDKNTQWDSVDTLRAKIKRYIDHNFEAK
ncbi:MAG: UDP-N-acetylglucosamine 4,6-dehydratase (inverting) [Paludibacteraceae bacterium]|nr:UDP-N-acetylglucosamine 4,6-dehydratase (inverting) [Paludibacteraceae bacterium]